MKDTPELNPLQQVSNNLAKGYKYISDAKYRYNVPSSNTKIDRFNPDEYTKYLGNNFSSGIDRDDARARAQGAWAKLGNASMKMVGLTLTTFAETFTNITVGTAEIVNRTINGVIDDNYSAAYSFAGFYDNPASRTYDQFNEYLEKAFPNYTTKKEQNSAWYENAFSTTGAANFWGDKFLKN